MSSARWDTAAKIPLGTRQNRGTPGTEPSLPTSLHPAVTHPLTAAQIHFSVSQSSWVAISPVAWERLARLTPGLAILCPQTLWSLQPLTCI